MTPTQNNSLHKLFRDWSDAYNEKGITQNAVMEVRKMDVPWTEQSIKELWRSVQAQMYPETVDSKGVAHVSKLSPGEVSKLYDALMGHLFQHFDVWVEFPSEGEE